MATTADDDLPEYMRLTLVERSLNQLNDMIGEYERRCAAIEAALPPADVRFGDEPLSDEDSKLEQELYTRTHRVEVFEFILTVLRVEGAKLAAHTSLPAPVESPVRVLRPWG